MSGDELALVAVQARLDVDALRSPEAFGARMTALAAQAADASAGAAHRLFVFPEDLGHFALLAFAPEAARRRATVDGAVGVLAATRPLALLGAALRYGAVSPTRAALLALCPAAQQLMYRTFGVAARRHRATIVAGSMLRTTADGRVHNSSQTFGPDGALRAITDKVNLVPGMEDTSPTGLGLARGDADGVPVVRAAWGALATLICYDAFCEPHTRNERFAAMGPRVDAAGVDVIANPSANPWPWDSAWVFNEPGEGLLRGDQWRREGLPATLRGLRHARYGVTAHLTGRVLDRSFEGPSEVLERRGGDVRVLARARSVTDEEIVVARVPVPAERVQ